jgi:hypothetical protein
MVVVTTLSWAGFAGGAAFVIHEQHDQLEQSRTTTSSTVDFDEVLGRVLPYYKQVAPAWCAEDMICWDGSKADGRTAEQVYHDLPCDIIETSIAYGAMTDIEVPERCG